MLPGPGHGQKGREGRAGGGPGARPGRGAACAAPQRPPPALQPRAPPAEPQRKGQTGEGGAGEGAHANPGGGRSGEVEEELSKERSSPSSGQAAEVQRSLRSDKKCTVKFEPLSKCSEEPDLSRVAAQGAAEQQFPRGSLVPVAPLLKGGRKSRG